MTEHHTRAVALALLALTASCSQSTSPDAASRQPPAPVVIESPRSGAPDFLTLASDAPPLAATSLRFWAIKGQRAQAFIWYHAKPGANDSTPLLRFRLDDRSLCTRPDGSPLPQGDSLLITITVIDPPKQIVQFEPSGLRFCPGREAKLNMWYAEDDHDFDGDGDIDSRDLSIETRLRIWRQESSILPWVRLAGVISADLDEVEAQIPGFTNYVVAY